MKLRLTQFPFFKGYVGNSRKLPDFSHHKKNKLNYLKSNSSMQMMNVNKCLKKASLFLSLKKKKRIFGCHTRVVYIYIGMWQLSILCVTWGGLIALYICVCVCVCVCVCARTLAHACWLFYSMMQITMGLHDPLCGVKCTFLDVILKKKKKTLPGLKRWRVFTMNSSRVS